MEAVYPAAGYESNARLCRLLRQRRGFTGRAEYSAPAGGCCCGLRR
jgi:hypothetical protein